MMFLTHITCLLAGIVIGMAIVNLIFTVKSVNMQIRKGFCDERQKRSATDPLHIVKEREVSL